jgi:hypothetical protein
VSQSQGRGQGVLVAVRDAPVNARIDGPTRRYSCAISTTRATSAPAERLQNLAPGVLQSRSKAAGAYADPVRPEVSDHAATPRRADSGFTSQPTTRAKSRVAAASASAWSTISSLLRTRLRSRHKRRASAFTQLAIE